MSLTCGCVYFGQKSVMVRLSTLINNLRPLIRFVWFHTVCATALGPANYMLVIWTYFIVMYSIQLNFRLRRYSQTQSPGSLISEFTEDDSFILYFCSSGSNDLDDQIYSLIGHTIQWSDIWRSSKKICMQKWTFWKIFDKSKKFFYIVQVKKLSRHKLISKEGWTAPEFFLFLVGRETAQKQCFLLRRYSQKPGLWSTVPYFFKYDSFVLISC